ncbi:MAG: hypothetical protein M3394_00115, partial [Actinomycetota bacterium]|nr:hypothetical protein [Actinomycetota bacterium]
MTDPQPHTTAGGLLGKVAGKAKAVLGSLAGDDDLAREGRLQEASVDAEAEARVRDEEAEQRRREAELEATKDEV